MRALPAHGQSLAMADAAVAADVHEALDAHGHLAPEVALDLVFALDDVADPRRLLVAPRLDPLPGVDARVSEDLLGRGDADSVDVLYGYFTALVPRQVHSGDTCHGCLSCPLALTLLVTRVLADDAYATRAPHDLAVLAPNLDRWSDFHLISFRAISPLVSGSPGCLRHSAAPHLALLLEPVGDPAAGQVVGGDLHLDIVLWQDLA